MKKKIDGILNNFKIEQFPENVKKKENKFPFHPVSILQKHIEKNILDSPTDD